MATVDVIQTVEGGNQKVQTKHQETAGLYQHWKFSAPDATADHQVAADIDVSALKAFYMVSDRQVIVETNSASTPDDSWTLNAGVPLLWTDQDYFPAWFSADVTAFFITNVSGGDATVEIQAVEDPTA